MWRWALDQQCISVDILDIFLQGNAPQSILCILPTDHFLLLDDYFGRFSNINVKSVFIQYGNIIFIWRFYSAKKRIVHP